MFIHIIFMIRISCVLFSPVIAKLEFMMTLMLIDDVRPWLMMSDNGIDVNYYQN